VVVSAKIKCIRAGHINARHISTGHTNINIKV